MTRWTRAPVVTLCGYCRDPRLIQAGEPCMEITLPGVQRRRLRCVTCAGPAPPDLPPLEKPVPVSPQRKMTRAKAVGMVLDFKKAQSGE